MPTIHFPKIKGATVRKTQKVSFNRTLNIARNSDMLTERILSDRNCRINDQRSKIDQLKGQMDQLQACQRTLKFESVRQEVILNRIEKRRNDFPRIFEKHDSEFFYLKERLRRLEDNLSFETKQRVDSDIRVMLLRDSIGKANQVLDDKDLDERSILQTRIKDLHSRIEAKEKCIQMSNKHLECLEKIQLQEMNSLKNQLKEYVLLYQDLESEFRTTQSFLQKKEKLLEIQNIYTSRIKGSKDNSESVGVLSSFKVKMKQFFDKHKSSESSFKKAEKDGEKSHRNTTLATGYSANVVDPRRLKEDIRQVIKQDVLSDRTNNYDVARNLSDGDNWRKSSSESCNMEASVESEVSLENGPTQDNSMMHQLRESEIDSEGSIDLRQVGNIETGGKNEENDSNRRLSHSYGGNSGHCSSKRNVHNTEEDKSSKTEDSFINDYSNM